ncbi:uncharacterized protein MELLADRAFT_112551 [Melampsora larici-populina 98AG31]|uniref:Translation machinery-associated protein 16 n=1 Tax=Melampsora larici-populina (strain 98AG31 / pathotype 3-4-7) TaxID=747676 RepID=F4S6U9_MELLP|nr:uncharacterized protein MELLADRAFT_112551 [Melampsora larici-populina 98AG31]EGF99639.1 hypothetical protein MELLADRAFT_112551 [Melampsora larici-populina 98AG31]
MPNNRVKTTKALQSKKGKAALAQLHPHSRRAKQICRVALRTDKLSVAKRERKKHEVSRINRLVWFCYALDPSIGSCTLPELHQIVQDFIHRHSAELESERKQRRVGRTKSVAQERIEIDQETEEAEYTTGFVVPDLTCPKSVKLLRQWCEEVSSDPSFLPRLRLIRIFKNDTTTIVEEQKGATESMLMSSNSDIHHTTTNQENQDDDTPELVMGD